MTPELKVLKKRIDALIEQHGHAVMGYPTEATGGVFYTIGRYRKNAPELILAASVPMDVGQSIINHAITALDDGITPVPTVGSPSDFEMQSMSIDGKALRGSRKGASPALQIVSAWASAPVGMP